MLIQELVASVYNHVERSIPAFDLFPLLQHFVLPVATPVAVVSVHRPVPSLLQVSLVCLRDVSPCQGLPGYAQSCGLGTGCLIDRPDFNLAGALSGARAPPFGFLVPS